MGRARVLSTVRFAHGLRRRRSANLIACGDRRILEEAVLDCVLAAVPEVMEVEGVGIRENERVARIGWKPHRLRSNRAHERQRREAGASRREDAAQF